MKISSANRGNKGRILSFLLRTGAYKMDFPVGGIVGENGYSKKQQEFESYLVGVDNDFESSIKIDYYSKIGKTFVELEIPKVMALLHC